MCQHGAQQENQQRDSRVVKEKEERRAHTETLVPVPMNSQRAAVADGLQWLSLSRDAATGSKACPVRSRPGDAIVTSCVSVTVNLFPLLIKASPSAST